MSPFPFLVALTVCGCVSLQRGLQTDEKVAASEAKIQDIERRLTVLEQAKAAQAEAVLRIGELEREIGRVRSRLEDRPPTGGEGTATLAERLERIEAQLREIEAKRQPGAPVPAPPPAESGPADPERAYEAAREAYARKAYEESLRGFQEFQKKFPQADLMDNAVFWEGMSYYALGNWKNAILRFEEIRTKYPKSNKSADATYFEALCFKALGDAPSAAALLGEVKQKFPKSDKAPPAEKLLKELSR